MEFKQVIAERKTNKDYTGEIVSDQTIDQIIELARFSPSSFGSEPWEVLVIKNEGKGKDLIQELKPLMWNQPNLNTASHIFFIFYKNRLNFIENSSYVNEINAKFDSVGADGAGVTNLMLNHIHQFESDINAWSRQQTYILLANILNAATSLGLGSTPMEGLEFPKVENFFREKNIVDMDLLNLGVVASVGVANGSSFDHLRFDKQSKFKFYN